MRAELIDAIHNEYKDHYRDATLVGSYRIFAPFFKVKLKMDYVIETDLNIIEQYVCRCVQEGITSVQDIMYVLSLSESMLLFTINELERNHYLNENGRELAFTEEGKKLYSQQIKHDVEQRIVDCYYDGLSPEFKIEFFGYETEHKFVKYKDIDEELKSNVLMPKTFPSYQKNKDFHHLSQRVLQHFNNESLDDPAKTQHKIVTITNFQLENEREVLYHEYLIMTYQNKDSYYHLLAYDPCGTEFVDQRLTQILQELHEMNQLPFQHETEERTTGDLDTILHALKNYASTKEINIDEDIRRESIEQLETITKNEAPSRYIMNYEIRKLFLHYLKEAKESLYIISPWMNSYIIDEEFLNDIQNLLKRGVKVSIIYGISAEEEQGDYRNQKTNRLAQKLSGIGKDFDGLFKIQHGQTHEKLVICDQKYYVNGSFNFLSYSGEDNGIFFRNEGSTYSEDPVLINETIKLRFND